MTDYAFLVLPAANRVYAESAVGLTIAELEVFGSTVLNAPLTDLAATRIGGVPYVTFSADPGLTPRDVSYLANLSSGYALFVRSADGTGETLLRPVELTPLDVFDDDLITIQKYAGKTNEHFTKLLLNVTVLASSFGSSMLDRRLHVFDPLCGRGTTLNQALMYGYDATGMDVDGKDFEAYSGFVRTWLKRKRIKHKAETTPVRRERRVLGRRLHVDIGADKQAYKSGDKLSLTMVNADTLQGREVFKASSFDVLVADLPYGVQHGSRSPAAALSRKPLELLKAALPVWVELLRPGGAVGLAWNTHVAAREEAAGLLTAAGLEVCDGPAYLGFRHRVDSSIDRDVLVARKHS
ncbi:TRM11 family SAM-dependent methyltransferase [Flindersiella endophytica]